VKSCDIARLSNRLSSECVAVLDCAESQGQRPGGYDGADHAQECTGLRHSAGLRLPTSQGL